MFSGKVNSGVLVTPTPSSGKGYILIPHNQGGAKALTDKG